MTSLSGVWAASLTPVTSGLAPDADRLNTHFERLVADGCDGIVLFGTTGEATSFSVAERIGLLDQLIEAGADPGRIIVGVGCAAAVDTVTLTRAASGHGVAGVLMLPPFYYKAVSDDDLAAAYGWIFGEVGADVSPVLLYNIPQVSGVTLSPSLVERLAGEYPDAVKGLKDSSGDLDSLRGFLAAMPGSAVFAGTELLLVPGLAEGAVGTISAAANINARHIRTAVESGDSADIEILREARTVLATEAVIPALKAVVADRLDDVGWAAVRPPFRSLAAGVGARLNAALPVA